MLNYWKDHKKPFSENESRAIPYCREEGEAKVGGSTRKTLTDDDTFNEQEEKSRGTKLCWRNVLRIYDLCSQSKLTSFDSSWDSNTEKKAECNKKIQIAKRKRDTYAAQRHTVQRRRNMRELQAHYYELF